MSSGTRSVLNEDFKKEKLQSSELNLSNMEVEISSKGSKSKESISIERSETSSVSNSEDPQDKLPDKNEDNVDHNQDKTILPVEDSRTSQSNVEIKQESVNYIGYYSSHEQLMQQLLSERVAASRHEIQEMVSQGMVHCRTHLLWNRLVSHHDLNQLTYGEFMELKTLARLENITQLEPTLKLLLDQPFSWYQGLSKLLLTKYSDQHRLYVSPDGNTQHLVILHPRYSSTFMVTSVDLHTSRGVSVDVI